MATIINPGNEIPHPITVPVGPKLMIQVSGHVPPHANGFSINLMTHTNDFAFHFNPRFDQGRVVLNTCLGGSWGAEESHPSPPFSRGGPFEVLLMLEHDRIMVAINGHHFAEYRHRVPLNVIKAVTLKGDVQVQMIREIVGVKHKPAFVMPPSGYIFPNHGGNTFPVHGGMHPGRHILVSGVAHDPAGFSVNLRAGPTGDIAFHFNPRFNCNQVVLNSCLGGGWGGEERPGNFPFALGVPFTLQIIVRKRVFKVLVNGHDFCKFPHRLQPLNRIDFVEVNKATPHSIQVF